MASLSEKFGDKLAILAFPSGEFGGQELRELPSACLVGWVKR